MATRCLLVSDNDLISAGVRSVLAPYADLVIYSLVAATDAEIIRATEVMQPDAIILDQRTSKVLVSKVIQLLTGQTHLRIVLINHEDNFLHVYQGQRFGVFQVTDLGSILCNQSPALKSM